MAWRHRARHRILDMIRRCIELLVHWLADLEFELLDGRGCHFFRTTWLRMMNVSFQEPVRLGREIYLKQRGQLSLGPRCAIGSFTRILNYAPICVGSDFISAGGLTLNSATHDPVTLAPIGKPITIGSRVWCGQNVTILAGVTIGDDVVIGAGSVVVDDILSGTVAVGVPARKVRDLDRAAGTRIHSWSGQVVTVPSPS